MADLNDGEIQLQWAELTANMQRPVKPDHYTDAAGECDERTTVFLDYGSKGDYQVPAPSPEPEYMAVDPKHDSLEEELEAALALCTLKIGQVSRKGWSGAGHVAILDDMSASGEMQNRTGSIAHLSLLFLPVMTRVNASDVEVLSEDCRI